MKAWASAPGKVILFGEHAVVYNQPAIALPLTQIKAQALAEAGRAGSGIVIHATDIGRHYLLTAVPDDEPLAYTCRTVLRRLHLSEEPDVELTLWSEIPIASGLGSGAATAAALAKALLRWLGWEPSPAQLSAIVYQTEQIHHGTPSGIDNTVVAYQQPVWFQRDSALAPFHVGAPLSFLVADTGVASRTRHTVGDVRAAWQAEPTRYEALFGKIGALVHQAHDALRAGDAARVGELMGANHALLREMGVSAPENDALVAAALAAGALGAKLSGGGRGGNNIVLVRAGEGPRVAEALRQAGATRVLPFTLEQSEPQEA